VSPDDVARGSPRPLPPRPPRPLVVHMLVDAAVAFLLTVLIFWIVGIPLWMTILFSIGVGIGAGPYTRRAEERGLATREQPSGDGSADRSADDR
jgi:hypothetical protein